MLAFHLGFVAARPSGAVEVARPHIVVVLIDTLRADRVGAYGYPRPTTPHLDRLAAQGLLFERAMSVSSWTRPAVASLFTSLLPSEHGATTFSTGLRPDVPTIAESLRAAGYRTLGFSGNHHHVCEKTGLARGFSHWSTIQPPANQPWPSAASIEAAVWQDLPAADAGPLFLYVHYMGPHAPYDPAAEFLAPFADDAARRQPVATAPHITNLAVGKARADATERQRLTDLYDGEVAAADAALGRLLDGLRQRGFASTSLTIVLSDHGESLGEHDSYSHGVNLFQVSLAVPLVIHDGRRPGTAQRRREPVDLLDVGPTILAAAGVPVAPAMRGRSLLADSPLPARELIAELHEDPPLEKALAQRQHRLALWRWPTKAILHRDGKYALYRLESDPGEMQSLDASTHELGGVLAESQATLVRLTSQAPDAAGTLNQAEKERLRALGYAR